VEKLLPLLHPPTQGLQVGHCRAVTRKMRLIIPSVYYIWLSQDIVTFISRCDTFNIISFSYFCKQDFKGDVHV
jgi:hypothetical protein